MAKKKDPILATDEKTAQAVIKLYHENKCPTQLVDQVVDTINARQKGMPILRQKEVIRSLRRLGLDNFWMNDLYHIQTLPYEIDRIGARYGIKQPQIGYYECIQNPKGTH